MDKSRDNVARLGCRIQDVPAMLKMRRSLIPVIICASYGLLLVAWAISNPPFAGADESAHYQRAIGVGNGQLIGAKAGVKVPEGASPETASMFEWANDATRYVDVLGGVLLPNPACNAQKEQTSASCLLGQRAIPGPSTVITLVGNYQPEAYLLPGWLVDRAHNPLTADRLGRLGTATTCLILLAVAMKLLWTGEAVSVTGILVAVTPMVLFTNAIINPSGLEIAASITFTAAILALLRLTNPAGWVWASLAVSGAMLALSRSPGPVWVVMGLVLMASLLDHRDRAALLRRNRAAVTICSLTLVVAIALNQVWEHTYGSHLRLTPSGFLHELRPAVHQLPNLIREEVGHFGSLDSPLALPLLAVWLMLTLTLVCVACYLGSTRERLVMATAATLHPVVAVLFYAVFLAGSGYAAQGRHLLPFGVVVPLLAADIVLRHRERLSARIFRTAAIAIPLVVAGVQAAAWYGNARRQAVGMSGPLWFVPVAQWSPPLGWWTWTGVVLAAAALLGVTGLISRPESPSHTRRADVEAPAVTD